MNGPTLVTPTLFNVTLNPYPGVRPKNPVKEYNMKDMFHHLSSKYTMPVRLNTSNTHFVDFIQVDQVFVCLPGGRGCVGKERMGRQMLDRQVALLDSKGIKYNPSYNHNLDTNYGFIHLVGFIQYKDGKRNNIVIPVEPSGVIGLRTGSSALSSYNPNTQQGTETNLYRTIEELEKMLNTAIQNENYELAAKIRDKIKKRND